MLDVSRLTDEEMMSFFAVLVRYSMLIAFLPVFGDRFVPATAKILLGLILTFALFPVLVADGQIRPGEAQIWAASTGGIVGTVALEALFGLVFGYTAKLAFDAINFGANMVGSFMGFSAATTFDPQAEASTQVAAELQLAIAMLAFLTLDGHHLMIRASLESYRIVGLGRVGFGAAFSTTLLDLTSQVIRFGIQIAAPIAVCLFAVNVAFGVMAKSMPQMNVLVLSFAVTTLVGMAVLFLTLPQFLSISAVLFERSGDWMLAMGRSMAGGGR